MKKLLHVLIKRLLTPIGLSIIFIWAGSNLSAADFSIEESVILTRDKDSGLHGNTVLAITGSKNGYLWLGTPSGLLRFDGLNFTTFKKENTPVLTNDRIKALFMSRDGTLWVGTDGGGLYALKNDVWKKYTTRDGLSNDHVNTIVEDFRGHIWIGTDYGLNRISPEGIQIFTTDNGLYDNLVTSLAMDNWGVLWIGTLKGGLVSYAETFVWHYGFKEGLKNLSVLSLAADPAGNIWIGTMEGLYVLDRENDGISAKRGTGYTPISSLFADSNGLIWVGTMADGLKWFEKGILHSYSGDDGFPDDYIRSIYRDDVGNLWFGTESAGFLQLRQGVVKSITRENGLADNAISALTIDGQGNLWVATRNDGLCVLKDDRVLKTYNQKSGLLNNRILALLSNEDGSIWIGTFGGGISRIKNSRVDRQLKIGRSPSDHVTAFAHGKDNMIWIGSDRGIYTLNTQNHRIEPGPKRLSGIYINFLHAFAKGMIYVGTGQGLFLINDGVVAKISVPVLNYKSLYIGEDGSLLLGSQGQGLIYFNGDTVLSCSENDGLPDNHIFSILGDTEKNLWLSSYRGIFKISEAELRAYFSGEKKVINPRLWDETDGLLTTQLAGSGNPLSVIARDGRLYFASSQGVAVLSSEKELKKERPPHIIIENTVADGFSYAGKKSISFPDIPDIISVFFTAIDFSDAGKLRFAYRLEGVDKTDRHIFPGQQRVAEYRNLPSGEYRFLIKAINNEGISSEVDSNLILNIPNPFYRNPLYQIIFVGLILILLFLFLAIRQRKISRRPEKYHTSTLNSQTADDIIPQLLDLMDKNKIYLDPDLTLRELAAKLRIHYNHLSQIINTRFEMSYNDYVNKYRIEEVQRQLKDPANNDRTVLEIMYDCGFYSKSVFNTAFKKFTGMTPSQFRK